MVSYEASLKIKAVQTLIPMKPTDHPRESCIVSGASENDGNASIFKGCFNLIFCYKKTLDEEPGSLVAGWMKESLAMALLHQPILAGRLRKRDGGGDGELEIVPNDSGVRLIEAQIDVSLQEFLDLKEKKDAEAALVFWQNIDHEINPQFSPLFYVQVTNFKCGAYSIGISCSLLLIDPFSMINFLKVWTKFHIQLITKPYSPKVPLFYRPNTNNLCLDQPNGSSTERECNSQTTIFYIDTQILNLEKDIHKDIAEICLSEAENKLGLETATRLSLYVKESSKEIKVRTFERPKLIQKPSMKGIRFASWDDSGAKEICFDEGNKPVYYSFWIRAVDDEAVVIVVPSMGKDGSGMKIIACLPV